MITSSPARVVIVEDQPLIRQDIELLVNQQPGFAVAGVCGSVQDAIQMIQSLCPEILLLDISLPDGDGFEILDQLPNASFKVIFLTAHSEHAIKAIKLDAIDYLLKPLDSAELKKALTKALCSVPFSIDHFKIAYEALKSVDNSPRIVLRFYEYIQVVEFNDILYCQSIHGYTNFILTNGRKIVTSRTIKEYEDSLPTNWFIRTHQSYIVNNRFIDQYYKEGYLILKDGTEIPVAARNRSFIMSYLNNNLK